MLQNSNTHLFLSVILVKRAGTVRPSLFLLEKNDVVKMSISFYIFKTDSQISSTTGTPSSRFSLMVRSIPSPGQRTSPSGLAGVLALMSARMALMTASFSSTVPNLVGSIAIMIWVRPISSPKVPMVWTALPPERRVAIKSSRMERPLPFQ